MVALQGCTAKDVSRFNLITLCGGGGNEKATAGLGWHVRRRARVVKVSGWGHTVAANCTSLCLSTPPYRFVLALKVITHGGPSSPDVDHHNTKCEVPFHAGQARHPTPLPKPLHRVMRGLAGGFGFWRPGGFCMPVSVARAVFTSLACGCGVFYALSYVYVRPRSGH